MDLHAHPHRHYALPACLIGKVGRHRDSARAAQARRLNGLGSDVVVELSPRSLPPPMQIRQLYINGCEGLLGVGVESVESLAAVLDQELGSRGLQLQLGSGGWGAAAAIAGSGAACCQWWPTLQALAQVRAVLHHRSGPTQVVVVMDS